MELCLQSEGGDVVSCGGLCNSLTVAFPLKSGISLAVLGPNPLLVRPTDFTNSSLDELNFSCFKCNLFQQCMSLNIMY